MEKLIKRVMAEEFWPEPAIRTAKRLKDMGVTETDVLKVYIENGIRIKVANALRDLEMAKQWNGALNSLHSY